MPIRQFLSCITVFFFLLFALPLQAADKSLILHEKGTNKKNTSPAKKAPKIDPAIVKQAEKIKKQLIQLNRELYQFEDDLLYPTNTQLAVFLSISSESKFTLDSIELRLDDQLVASYLYKDNEVLALKKGGIQRVYLGSLSDGKHKLSAQFNGQKTTNSYFRRKKAFTFTKEHKAKFIEMVISESKTTREPLFKVKLW